jgi:hypothetical protein
MAKKHDLSDTKFSVCHAPLPLPYAKFVPRLQPRQCAKSLAIIIARADLLRETKEKDQLR